MAVTISLDQYAVKDAIQAYLKLHGHDVDVDDIRFTFKIKGDEDEVEVAYVFIDMISPHNQ